jgi:hypothetical protein
MSEKLGNADAFWRWFAGVSGALATDPTNDDLIGELDSRIAALGCPGWEIGPGSTKAWFLALSPCGDPEQLPVTRVLVGEAPELSNWEFLPARPPKQWDLYFEVAGEAGPLEIDARGWEFVLYRYPDNLHDVVVLVPDTLLLSPADRTLVARIAVEGQLGEEPLLTSIRDIEAVTDWSDAERERARPLRTLVNLGHGPAA